MHLNVSVSVNTGTCAIVANVSQDSRRFRTQLMNFPDNSQYLARATASMGKDALVLDARRGERLAFVDPERYNTSRAFAVK